VKTNYPKAVNLQKSTDTANLFVTTQESEYSIQNSVEKDHVRANFSYDAKIYYIFSLLFSFILTSDSWILDTC
jgi:hypothetical protein